MIYKRWRVAIETEQGLLTVPPAYATQKFACFYNSTTMDGGIENQIGLIHTWVCSSIGVGGPVPLTSDA